MPPVVEARDLCRRFGRRWALARVELDIGAGERFLVVGANGSGKTTLIRLLATLSSRSRGELRLFGLDPAAERFAIRRRLAFLSHQPALYEDLSGPQNLAVLARLLDIEDRTEAWLEEVGLDVRDDPVRSYSAGMRKRLAFARVIAQAPELALLDEPYGQLDPEGFVFVDALVRRLADAGTTVVMASHHVQRAAQLSDRALVLHAGLPRWSGPAGDAHRAWSALHGQAA